MVNNKESNVDVWLTRETEHIRKALENASRHFNENDNLTVHTIEAVYGQESSFGTLMGDRGIKGAAGHFQMRADTAKRYGLTVTKTNDQRFDIDYASSAASRYLKDLYTFYSKDTVLVRGRSTVGVKDTSARRQFVLAAYNAGEGRIAKAQSLTKKAGLNPQLWSDVQQFLEKAGSSKTGAKDARDYVPSVLFYETEFTKKSPANKNLKGKKKKKQPACTVGHWGTINDRPVFICD